MKLMILSRSGRVPSTARLVSAARARGHAVRVVSPGRVQMHLEGGRGTLYCRRKKIAIPDVVVPRIAASVASYGLAVLEQLEAAGVRALNRAPAVGLSRNLLRVLQRLSAAGIAVPSSVMAREAADLRAMVSLVGGVPVLVKLLHGTERRGAMVCESPQSLEATLEAVLGLGHDLLIQQTVQHADVLRALVVGGRVVAAMRKVTRGKRRAPRKARFAPAELTPAQRRVVERAAATLELELCSIDVLAAQDHTFVVDVDAVPALPDFQTTTGVDVALAIVDRCEALARTPRLRAAHDKELNP